MDEVPEPNGGAFWAYGLLLLLSVGWFALSLTEVGRHAADIIRNILPRWCVAANLIVAPIAILLAAGPWYIASSARLVCAALFVVSLVLAQAAAWTLPFPFLGMLMIVLIEVYWFIPKWKARKRRSR